MYLACTCVHTYSFMDMLYVKTSGCVMDSIIGKKATNEIVIL